MFVYQTFVKKELRGCAFAAEKVSKIWGILKEKFRSSDSG
jgi:hypothetical protein